MSRDDIFTPIGERITIGLSAIVGITAVPGQNFVAFYKFAGGSCEIVSPTLIWGQGYMMGEGERSTFNGSGTFYIAATGATVTLCVFRGRSQGFNQ